MRTRPLIAAAALACALTLAACTGPTTPSPGPTDRPEGIDVGRSIVYAEVDGTELAMDACIPEDRSAGPFPGVVLIHGGAFREGNRSNMLGLCQRLAADGVAAFPLDYRLIPASFPAQVEDVMAAVGWLRQPAQTERFDLSGDISLLGSSAGAIIALTAADALADAGASVSAVVSLSAAGDLTVGALALGSPDPALEDVVLAYLGCADLRDCPHAVDASPIHNVAGLPPTLLVHGSDELIPLEQAEALEGAIREAGGEVTLVVVDGALHGLQVLDGGTGAEILRFLVDNMSR